MCCRMITTHGKPNAYETNGMPGHQHRISHDLLRLAVIELPSMFFPSAACEGKWPQAQPAPTASSQSRRVWSGWEECVWARTNYWLGALEVSIGFARPQADVTSWGNRSRTPLRSSTSGLCNGNSHCGVVACDFPTRLPSTCKPMTRWHELGARRFPQPGPAETVIACRHRLGNADGHASMGDKTAQKTFDDSSCAESVSTPFGPGVLVKPSACKA